MLCLRQISSVRSPVSASLSIRIICSVVRLVFFIDAFLSLIDENQLIKSGLVHGGPTKVISACGLIVVVSVISTLGSFFLTLLR